MTDLMIGLLFLVSKHCIKALETNLIHLGLCIRYQVSLSYEEGDFDIGSGLESECC